MLFAVEARTLLTSTMSFLTSTRLWSHTEKQSKQNCLKLSVDLKKSTDGDEETWNKCLHFHCRVCVCNLYKFEFCAGCVSLCNLTNIKSSFGFLSCCRLSRTCSNVQNAVSKYSKLSMDELATCHMQMRLQFHDNSNFNFQLLSPSPLEAHNSQ